MNPILVALQQALEALVSTAGVALADWLVNLFKNHVLAHKCQGMEKAAVRASARQWVTDMVAELTQDAATKLKLPAFVLAFLPLLQQAVAQVLDSALDAAGL